MWGLSGARDQAALADESLPAFAAALRSRSHAGVARGHRDSVKRRTYLTGGRGERDRQREGRLRGSVV